MSISNTEIVEKFIRRTTERELIFDDKKAQEIKYMVANTPTTITDALSRSLMDYQVYKEHRQLINSETDSGILTRAAIAFVWINRVYMLGVVKEGPAIFQKLSECQNENAMLRKELDSMSQKTGLLEQEKNQFSKVGQLGDLE